MPYTVRDYDNNSPDDPARLAAMFNTFDAVWPGGFTRGVPETAEGIRQRGERMERLAILIVEAEEEFAGYCDLKSETGETEVAYIPLLGAHPDHHGKGVGKMLLREMVRRVTEKGFRELTLHTWAGNLKAVPLYKKTGFHWVPETQVFMRNFLPSCLTHPVGRTFFADRDWYQVFERDLEVAPDDIRWKGMKVFVYHFREGEDFLRFTFDATSGGLTALETQEYRVGCYLPVEEAPAGETVPFTWEITPRRGKSLDVLLMTETDPGLELRVLERLTVDRETAVTRDLKVAADARPTRWGEKQRRVRTTLLIDGQPVALETGVNVVRPVLIDYGGEGLLVGRERKIEVRLRSQVDHPLAGVLTLDAHPGLDVPAAVQPFVLQPRLRTQCEFTVTARVTGALPTTLRLAAEGVHGTRPVVFRGLSGSGPVASLEPEVAEEAVLEMPGLRAHAYLRGGWLHLRSTNPDEGCWGLPMPEPGPPFVEWRSKPLICSTRFETRNGETCLVMSAASPEFPGLVMERTVSFLGDSVARVRHRVINTASYPQKSKVQIRAGLEKERFFVVPYADGIVREPGTDWEHFPTGDRDAVSPERQPAESWLATESKTGVAGLIWQGQPEVEVSWGCVLRYDAGEIPANGTADLPEIYLTGGAGDWAVVRNWWRHLVQPSGTRETHRPETHRVLEIDWTSSPTLLTGETLETVLHVRNRRGKAESGVLKVTGDRFRIEPETLTLDGVRWDREATFPVRLTAPEPPSAERLTVALETPTAVRTFPLPVIRVGAGDRLTVEPGENGLFTVTNGWLTFRVASAFAGAMVELETEGVNHLFSAYPTARPFVWANPWFGGVHLYLDWMCDARLARETFRGEPVTRTGERGLVWQGVRVWCQPEHKDLRWLGIEAEYLTLPGSNLVALIARRINRTNARTGVNAGFAVWCQPGGSRERSTAHWKREEARRYRHPGGFPAHFESDSWTAVENGATGEALLLISAEPGHSAEVEHYGAEGPHLVAGAGGDLAPDESREVLSWLVLTRDLTQADAYAHLAQIHRLP
ncbi:MAG: GNAT family N-acetyltransferase [Capsulimonadales bacterium]|nr:GNAT family N-acetyltransferase [Capsulimonadales bacterium]